MTWDNNASVALVTTELLLLKIHMVVKNVWDKCDEVNAIYLGIFLKIWLEFNDRKYILKNVHISVYSEAESSCFLIVDIAFEKCFEIICHLSSANSKGGKELVI